MFLCGCTSKEVSVSHPNGKSLTYNFFKTCKYDENKYTLKLKNGDRDITVIHSDNKTYYEVVDNNVKIITIEKDNFKYKLNTIDKSYTKESIDDYTDYALGYIPSDLKKLKNLKYKTGSERRNLINYKYEKYVYNGGTTVYYYRGKSLKFIKNITSFSETEVKFVELLSKVNKNKFDIPNGYMEIDF